MTETLRERQVSRKAWIREINQGEFVQKEQGNSLKTSRGEVIRVNIIGVIISKEELPVSSLTVDDGTGQIVIRSFDQKLNQSVGTIVQVIGRPRMYQGALYVAAEAVAVVAPGWLQFRKKELGPVVETIVEAVAAHEAVSAPNTDENRVETIIRLIKELDPGDGAPIEMVAFKSKIADAETIIEQLLLTGDIFELRPGKVKVL